MRRLNKLQRENLFYLLFGIFFVVGGYFFLRIAYKLSDHLPFTQEIVLIVLGTIVTVLITAMLLNKQTEVELKKEENVKFLDLKTEVYFDLLARIEEILLSGHAGDDDLLRLRFLSHRLAVVACPPVLEQYRRLSASSTRPRVTAPSPTTKRTPSPISWPGSPSPSARTWSGNSMPRATTAAAASPDRSSRTRTCRTATRPP